MEYIDAIEFMKKSYDKEIRLGLERIKELLELLGNPQDNLKFVHVAGTNGKGSVCAMTAEILKSAGYCTGMFTSPVIWDYCEQFMIDGQIITEEEFCAYANEIKQVCDKMTDHPSEFEKCVALAFLYFWRKKCDIVVLEVGMGGDLDATNVISSPEVTAIVNIDYDHMGFLGNTLAEIAEKKAGIIKENISVVVAEQNSEVMQLIRIRSAQQDAMCYETSIKDIQITDTSLRGQVISYKKYRDIELALLGKHQSENMAIVLEIIDCLIRKEYEISENAIRQGLKQVHWKGRFDVFSADPVVILDGAHNPDGIEALKYNLLEYFPDKKFVFIVGILRDKDYRSMLGQMIPFAEAFVTIEPNNARAMSAVECAKAIRDAGYAGEIDVSANYSDAIKKAYSLSKGMHPICAFGSLYSLGELYEKFDKIS